MNVKILKPVSIKSMTQEEFDTEVEKGYQDVIDGNIISANEVFKGIREEYNLSK